MFKIHDGREFFYQWDLDRKLIVEDTSINHIHFCNQTDSNALVCEIYDEDGLRLVNVPNVLLQESWRITAYGYDVNYTKHSMTFDVQKRTKPDDYVYTETETLNYNVLLERINEIDNSIEQTVEDWLKENPPDVDVDLTDYATKEYVYDLVENDTDVVLNFVEENYVKKEDWETIIPTFLTDIPDEYLTDSEAEEKYARITDIPDVSEFITEIPSEYVTETELSAKGYLTEHQDLSEYAKLTDIPNVEDFIVEIPSEYITETELNAKGFATTAQIPDVSAFQTEEQVIALIEEYGGGTVSLPASEDGEF